MTAASHRRLRLKGRRSERAGDKRAANWCSLRLRIVKPFLLRARRWRENASSPPANFFSAPTAFFQKCIFFAFLLLPFLSFPVRLKDVFTGRIILIFKLFLSTVGRLVGAGLSFMHPSLQQNAGWAPKTVVAGGIGRGKWIMLGWTEIDRIYFAQWKLHPGDVIRQ